MSDIGIKISKENKNVGHCADKDLIISSKFDTLKVGYTGRLTLNVPDWNYNYISTPISKTDSTYFTHDLGYIPYYTPRCAGESLPGITWEPFNIYVNEVIQEGPFVSYSPPTWIRGAIDIYTTSTRLYLRTVREYNYSPFPDSDTWKGGTVYVDYTIFRNKMN